MIDFILRHICVVSARISAWSRLKLMDRIPEAERDTKWIGLDGKVYEDIPF